MCVSRRDTRERIVTLDQLIKACGDEFCALRRTRFNTWYVDYRSAPRKNRSHYLCMTTFTKTPKQAVQAAYVAIKRQRGISKEKQPVRSR
jgi:hypothetical protein